MENMKTLKQRIREDFYNDPLVMSLSAAKVEPKVEVMSPRQLSLSPPTSPTRKSSEEDPDSPPKMKKKERPRTYKVEKTPPMGEDGLRHCSDCNGEVRPQMCGSRKHRWRCVAKKCRKWYGWVKTTDTLPHDVNRGRQCLLLEKGKPRKKAEKLARQPKIPAPKKPKVKKEASQIKQEPLREISPLTEREARYRPDAMEKRARWWTSEKRKPASPERELSTTMADAAAAFRITSLAFRAASMTKANEVGTVNGSLDLMMDSMMGCIGPLLSLLTKLPIMRPYSEATQTMWEASVSHIPTFH